jgi:hypothetical protein
LKLAETGHGFPFVTPSSRQFLSADFGLLLTAAAGPPMSDVAYMTVREAIVEQEP